MSTQQEQVALEQLAAAIEEALPDLAGSLRPLTLLGEGYTAVAVESVGGIVFRVPRTEAAAGAAAIEKRLLAAVGSDLPAAVPDHTWLGGPSEACPWGFAGYRKVPGITLDITGLDGAAAERLAQRVATFLVALHGTAIETATAAGVPGDWHQRYEQLFEASLPPLRAALRPDELSMIEAWWLAFFDAPANWDFQPTLVHGDVRPEHLLTDNRGSLTGVIDFGDACIGDPAIDIGGLLAYVDALFAEHVQAAYERLRGVSDGDVMRRARLLAASTPFFTVAAATAGPGPAMPSLDEAIAELRAGAILRG